MSEEIHEARMTFSDSTGNTLVFELETTETGPKKKRYFESLVMEISAACSLPMEATTSWR